MVALALPFTDVEDIERLLHRQLTEERLYPGLALAVYRGAERILELVAGYADTQCATLVDHDSLFPMFSGSKPFAATALWQLIEQGRIGLDDRVIEYWPSFAQHGKHTVLIWHLLCHRGGFPNTPDSLSRSAWGDVEKVKRELERLVPEFPAGSVSAYHFLTQHWVIGELVRIVDGRTYREYLQEEILDPLRLSNTHLVVAGNQEERCVKLHATDGTDAWGIEIIQSMHSNPLYRTAVPGASLVSTAADMARFYAAIAAGGELDGARILRPETVHRMLDVVVDGETDPSFDLPVRRCYGFELGGLDEPRRHWPGSTSTVQTFWHGGMGSSVCWGDRDTGLSFALLTNGVRRDKAGAIARRDISDLVRRTCSQAV